MFWGVDQLFPSRRVATTPGDVVISLYVLDVGRMMIDRLKQRNHKRYETIMSIEKEASR